MMNLIDSRKYILHIFCFIYANIKYHHYKVLSSSLSAISLNSQRKTQTPTSKREKQKEKIERKYNIEKEELNKLIFSKGRSSLYSAKLSLDKKRYFLEQLFLKIKAKFIASSTFFVF